jgi:hypothetical protein
MEENSTQSDFSVHYIPWKKLNEKSVPEKLYLGMENSLVMMNKMYVEYGCTFDLRSFPFDNQKCAMNFSMDSAKAKYIVLSPNEIAYQVRQQH